VSRHRVCARLNRSACIPVPVQREWLE